ncbi:hypothetical protein [Kitasatospora griseola]|uniref:hypothetical protein n=1 Tax=Kitasatospora griseola TaxID=2064 RepID=UPI00167152B8|nr:hypothetical protein [Kitasatospora griseola]GGQ65112.1 hypothetical protein GCM10010195_20850 [Kitasatospora griseola]
MPDLLWDDVRDFLDPDLMGALPDLFVSEVSVEDWQALFDLVEASGWAWEWRVGVSPGGALPAAAEVFARPVDAETVELRVQPVAGVLVIFRPRSAEEIEFDVDLRELQGQAGVDLLCGLLRTIGRRLGKVVAMTAEGDHGNPVLGFDPVTDRVVLMAEPQSTGRVTEREAGARSRTAGSW